MQFTTWYDTQGQVHAAPPGGPPPGTETVQPGSYTPGGKYIPLDSTPLSGASDMAAAILASEFTNWEKQFKPIEMNLLDQSSLNNPQILTDAVTQAGTQANQTFDSLAGVESRQLAARGINPNSQQQEVSSRLRNLSRATAVAGAENQARANVASQDELIALGSVPNNNIVQGSIRQKIGG